MPHSVDPFHIMDNKKAVLSREKKQCRVIYPPLFHVDFRDEADQCFFAIR